MKVAKLNSDNTIAEIGDHRAMFPNVSFPTSGPTADWMTDNNVASVTVGLSHNAATQRVEEVTPYLSEGVVYTVRAVDLTADEKTAKQTETDTATATANRKTRDRLLADTDWVVIKALETDTAIGTNWKTYRQALRDLPVHSNWPNLAEDDWPTKPAS